MPWPGSTPGWRPLRCWINYKKSNHERLIVPHYGMKEREFVLLPLAEIAPALVLPCGTPLARLVARCPHNDLAIIAPRADLQEPL